MRNMLMSCQDTMVLEYEGGNIPRVDGRRTPILPAMTVQGTSTIGSNA
jgi:hypothetical protein